ncbi:MAG: hypothetical protein N3A02_03450, partial [Rectinema sp.]|nr:hypothetical protein [Rectinema sp.]
PWGHVYRDGREIEALVWSSSVTGFATYRLFPWLRLGVIGLWDYADMESDDDHLVSRDFQHRPEVGPYIEVTPWRGGHLQAFVGRGFGSYHGTSIALGFVLNF